MAPRMKNEYENPTSDTLFQDIPNLHIWKRKDSLLSCIKIELVLSYLLRRVSMFHSPSMIKEFLSIPTLLLEVIRALM